ncbi:MAG: caa(3)-type oxidase, subunit [Verrucomicrobia bacterium]|nr:caa(3)-type oxidase, subunit [Verrucomicrobiota bacterium]
MPSTPSPFRPVLLVFAGLMAALMLSAAASYGLSGTSGTVVSLFFATVKLALIFAFFMKLREQAGLVRLFAMAGFFWLAIAGVLIAADYATRG